ncbi:MAG: amidase family protein, partial [Parvibaculum sp.]
LDATSGDAPGDPYVAPAKARPFLDEVGAPTGRLRIAFSSRRPNGSESHPDVVKAVEEAATLCESLGHIVEEAAPKFDPENMSKHQATIVGANVALTLRQRAAQLGREITPEDVEHITWLIAQAAGLRNSVDYAEGTLFMHRLSRQMAEFHETYDVYLSPTLHLPPVELGKLDMMGKDIGAYLRLSSEYMPGTAPFNMTGQPSMSMPLHWNAAGLPVGTMFTGRFGDEATLFRLAAQIEEAKPWADRRPAL